MKKSPFIILLLASIVFSQSKKVEDFKLTPDGFPDQYVVLEFENTTSDKIFTNLKRWAEYNIKNAEYSNYSEVQNEFLAYTMVLNDAVFLNWFGGQYFSPEFDVELRIKGNRLRIDLLNKGLKDGTNATIENFEFKKMFKRDGRPRKMKIYADAIIYTENSIAKFVALLESAVKGKVDLKKDDW